MFCNYLHGVCKVLEDLETANKHILGFCRIVQFTWSVGMYPASILDKYCSCFAISVKHMHLLQKLGILLVAFSYDYATSFYSWSLICGALFTVNALMKPWKLCQLWFSLLLDILIYLNCVNSDMYSQRNMGLPLNLLLALRCIQCCDFCVLSCSLLLHLCWLT